MQTEIRLLNVPLEADYKHTIYFGEGSDGKQAQETYFKARTFKAFDDLTYQRKDNKIRVPLHYDEVANNCNYVMYRNNTESNGKWYFAFITKIEYVNDERTDVYIATDVIQTWYFDYKLNPCFVEREHVVDDTKGANTVPEGLETGEYVTSGDVLFKPLLRRGYIVGCTVDLNTFGLKTDATTGELVSKFDNASGTIYNGVFSGVKYFYFNDTSLLSTYLKQLANCGQADSVLSIFMAPTDLIEYTTPTGPNDVASYVNQGASPKTLEWNSCLYSNRDNWERQISLTKPDTIDGYEPKNNKLFTFPYCYLQVNNNAGSSGIYHFEYFKEEPNFNVHFAITPGCSIRANPLKYKNLDENYEEGLNGGKLPICAWTTDVYTNWLTQNSLNFRATQENIVLKGVTSTAQGALGGAISGAYGGPIGVGLGALLGATGGAITGISSGIQETNSVMGQIYEHSLYPPQASGNINSGDVTYSDGKLTFQAITKTIKKEFARCIDGYFSMYGYKVNRIKTPNINHRERYWYTKTIGCEIDGAIPIEDIQRIKQCYDNGITFWRANYDIGVYCDKDNNLYDNIIKQ